jgi:diguanylate cyclase (GGDEF)-like protein/PAS domain S-box-containing protein
MRSSESAEVASLTDLPDSVRLAGELAGLDAFLGDAAIGFHWAMLDQLEDGVYVLDLERRIRYWSRGAERITGYTAAEALGGRCADNLLKHVDAQGRCLCTTGCPLAAVMADGQPRAADVFLHHRDGHRVPVHVFGEPIRDWQGRIIGSFETFSDATESVAAVERIRALEAEAHLDALTGLPNRRYIDSVLATRFAEFNREGLRFGLVVADVDHFKSFNDQYGHEVGDEVLKMVARTLTHSCRTYDVAARWGGEEFVVLSGHGDAQKVGALADRLRALVEHSTLAHAGHALHVTISLGATVVRDEDDAASLFARADRLLYQSKAGGRNRATVAP